MAFAACLGNACRCSCNRSPSRHPPRRPAILYQHDPIRDIWPTPARASAAARTDAPVVHTATATHAAILQDVRSASATAKAGSKFWQHQSPAEPAATRRAVLTAVSAAALLPLLAPATAAARPLAKGQGGDWTSPGLASVEDDAAPRFIKTDSGVKIQELRVGSGPTAKAGDRVVIEYVLRRANGYFIYSNVEGVSFQPRDTPIGPVDFTLGDGRQIAGLEEVIAGMQPAGKRRALIPPAVGYVQEGLEPQPPGFGARRQVINHASEPLIFEVQLLKIRS